MAKRRKKRKSAALRSLSDAYYAMLQAEKDQTSWPQRFLNRAGTIIEKIAALYNDVEDHEG